jgi:hypothetical protein
MASSSLAPLTTEVKERLVWENIAHVVPVISSITTWDNPTDASRIDLGCFTKNGEWTEKRTECAASQQPFVEQLTIEGRTDDDVSTAVSSRPVGAAASSVAAAPATPELREVRNDAPIRTVIDQDFVPDQKRASKLAGLRASVQDTVASLDRLMQSPLVSTEAKESLRQRSQRLQQGIADVDTLTISEIDARIEVTRKQIDEISIAVKEAVKPMDPAIRVPTDADIAAILAKLDRIVTAAPDAHALLTSQGLTVKSGAVEALASARLALQKTRDCGSLSRCQGLPDTVTALEQWRDGMRLSAGSRTDLLQKIDDMIAAQ